ncbi:phytanoyl-CoA dioxygenase family protein [Sphingomonadaceae bacterium G21617-S1]|nr:phytanoyl-CoA dioxygenase family protein [Sphingomonadaceae bacterium G21617-S1]
MPLLGKDGAQHFKRAALSIMPALLDVLEALPTDRPGIRLHGHPELAALLAADNSVGSIAANVLGPKCRAVRAILFDKSPGNNWALGWHQDRTIAVQQRIDQPGFGPWTIKEGMQHVAPPFALLESMITLRVHLDPVTAYSAPLIVALGSHRLGRIAEGDIASIVRRHRQLTCLADPGDVWAYATPILHASEASMDGGTRRVLQVDYSASDLPGDLDWLGL